MILGWRRWWSCGRGFGREGPYSESDQGDISLEEALHNASRRFAWRDYASRLRNTYDESNCDRLVQGDALGT